MAVVTMKQLLESGVHFGHQTRRWNPKMKRFIFTERNGIYIIDLQQSLSYIDRAYEFIKETVATAAACSSSAPRSRRRRPSREQATRVGMPYVNQRWLGGMLTNFQTVHKRLQRLKELEEIDFDGHRWLGLTKKELLMRQPRDGETRAHARRYPGHGADARARSGSSTPRRSTSPSTRRASSASPLSPFLDTNCDPDEVTTPSPATTTRSGQ